MNLASKSPHNHRSMVRLLVADAGDDAPSLYRENAVLTLQKAEPCALTSPSATMTNSDVARRAYESCARLQSQNENCEMC